MALPNRCRVITAGGCGADRVLANGWGSFKSRDISYEDVPERTVDDKDIMATGIANARRMYSLHFNTNHHTTTVDNIKILRISSDSATRVRYRQQYTPNLHALNARNGVRRIRQPQSVKRYRISQGKHFSPRVAVSNAGIGQMVNTDPKTVIVLESISNFQ